ncbi:MAG: hypothetical protein JW755_07685, partial [Candidatus Aminicenantes bacterium]|nr:hypothetical protein [Candidatus Aminicenantes bacterium]
TLGFYRTEINQYRKSAFNPENRSVERLGFDQNPHFFLSQFFSLEGNWESVSWQADIWGQAEQTKGKKWEGDFKINQMFVQMDLWENWVLLAGRSIQRWGTGYAYNPTDMLAPEKELRDPDNAEKRAVGNDMVKLEYFDQSFSLAMCIFTQLRFRSGIRGDEGNLALRLYKNLWDVDLSLVALFNSREHPVWGLNFAYVLGERLEIHGELSAQKGSYQSYHPLIENPYSFYLTDPFLMLKKNDHTFYLKYLLGFQYTFGRNILWVAEYYHQDTGYTQTEWSRAVDYVHYLNDQRNTAFKDLAEINLLWALKVFSSKGTMKDYLMNHCEIPIQDRIQLSATVLTNLHDLSSIFIPQVNYQIQKHFTFYARSFIFLGDRETEYGEFFNSFTFESGLRLHL